MSGWRSLRGSGPGALSLLLLVLQSIPVGAHGPGARAPAEETPAGILSLDVYAQDEVLDLLVTVDEGEGSALRHRRSVDGGGTWGPEHAVGLGGAGVASPHRGSDAQIAADGERLVVLWTAPGTSPWGTGPLASALSEDGGRTWRPGPNPADSGSTGGHGYADLLVDEAGKLHAVWIDERAGRPGLYAAVSSDGGRTWSRNRTVDSTTCSCCWNRLAATGRGGVAVVYRDERPRDLTVATSRDAGESWSRGAAPGGFGWEMAGCPMTGGGLARATQGGSEALYALIWTGAEGRVGLHFSRSDDSGRSWSAVEPVADGRGHRGDLAGAGGLLGAAWDLASSEGRRVLAAVSADGGRTWSEPKTLSAAGANATQPLVVPMAGAFRAFWTEQTPKGGTVWASALFGE